MEIQPATWSGNAPRRTGEMHFGQVIAHLERRNQKKAVGTDFHHRFGSQLCIVHCEFCITPFPALTLTRYFDILSVRKFAGIYISV